ncbi:transmembrane protein, putative [Rhizoctonia solani AG-3 Rhs1AP]|uniref:Transmembrane protein, putative n=2 Tax=Rhizoctonia solani AG-3 TaxID=1086053 RepID=X8IWJ6_9AGAM|nr:transmembrane protein, putative [Rhizoctonia solani AG-3 Rhs1AP]KEP51603.1 putative transmembrane protein [Rhizoctonia solani 123E]
MSLKTGNPPLVYDENLLAQAPEVTQGQRQEGYDADILNPSPPPTSRTPAPSQPYRDHLDVESGSSGHDKHLAAGGYGHVGQSAKKPFWKTPKGIIILAVLALVVIAAVVGGAVGGTVGKNKNDNPGEVFPGSGSNNTSPTTTNTNTVQPPSETTGGGDTPGGGGSNQSSSTRLDGASPTSTASVSRPSTTTATITSPAVDPPAQPGAGDGA